MAYIEAPTAAARLASSTARRASSQGLFNPIHDLIRNLVGLFLEPEVRSFAQTASAQPVRIPFAATTAFELKEGSPEHDKALDKAAQLQTLLFK